MNLMSSRKKNKDGLRQLTEREIQHKLYGEFAQDHENPKMVLPKVQVKPTSNIPIQPPKFTPLNSQEGLDLFSISQDVITKETEKKQTVNQNQIPEKMKQKFAEYEKTENKQHRVIPPLQGSQESQLKKQFRIPRFKIQVNVNTKAIMDAIAHVAENLFLFIAGAIKGIFDYLYLKRKGFRKIGIWALGFALIFILFVAVNNLNVKREKALKSPVKKQNTIQEERENAGNSKKKSKSQTNVNVIQPASGQESSIVTLTPAADVSQETHVEGATQQRQGRFVIQIATYKDEMDAKRMADKLSAANWPAFVKGASRAGGGVYYSVYIGRYLNYQEAQENFSRFKKSDAAQPFQDSFIRALHESN